MVRTLMMVALIISCEMSCAWAQVPDANKHRAAGHTQLIKNQMLKNQGAKVKVVTPAAAVYAAIDGDPVWHLNLIYIVSPVEAGGDAYLLAQASEGKWLNETTFALSGRRATVTVPQFNEFVKNDKDLEITVGKFRDYLTERAAQKADEETRAAAAKAIEELKK